MNYIINKIDDHDYYSDLFINNLKYISENQFHEIWKNCNAKSLNNINKNPIIQAALNEFMFFSNFKNILNIFLNKDVKIKNYQGWVNRYGHGEFQEPHDHLNKKNKYNSYSYVYFLNIPENASCFNFCDNDGNNKKYINEKSGDLLIFKSTLWHSVDKNTSDQYRYTLAGNLEIE